MGLAELEMMLAKSLDDHRLSRGEKRALRTMLEDGELGPRGVDHLRKHAFQLAHESSDSIPTLALFTWLEDLMRLVSRSRPVMSAPSSESGAWFSPGEECRRAILRELSGVPRGKQVDICVFSITDNVLSDGLRSASRRGVHMRILSDNDKRDDLGSDIRSLRSAGIDVAVDQSNDHMHHKFAIFGTARLLSGSYNWTRAAATRNHENLMLTTDPKVVKAYQDEFERLWGMYGGA